MHQARAAPRTPPAPLPLRWFNMRESKCTIQNLKTGLWGAARPPRAPKGAQAKGKGGLHGPWGGEGGGHAAYINAPHLGGCSDTHNTMLWHNCLVVCHSRGGLEGSPARQRRAWPPQARSLLLLVSCCGLLFGGPRRLLGGRALLVAGDRGMRGVQLAGGSPALGTRTC